MDSQQRPARKPRPLFNIFRKNKPVDVPPPITTLGSGTTAVLMSSIVTSDDPYAPHPSIRSPRSPDPRNRYHQTIANIQPQPQSQPQPQKQSDIRQERSTPNDKPSGRPRSKSVGREAQRAPPRLCHRSLTAREQTLYKLCQNEQPTPASLANTPSRPLRLPLRPLLDLQKDYKRQQHRHIISPRSAKDHSTQQEAQQPALHTMPTLPPIINANMNRSKSLNAPKKTSRRPKASNNSNNGDDDDDMPLASTLLRQAKANRSLLNDEEEEDDKDLVPIATLSDCSPHRSPPVGLKSAAAKYKEKVKERLQLDDDDMPIQIARMRSRNPLGGGVGVGAGVSDHHNHHQWMPQPVK
ncbi:hypothetical protein J3Q64DRAFT_1697716 [Phycomyces blakesleeanus]|uniref:Uncharacterized protein n=1 Tax=Phycomyces blakesleeanus TaxID=4837 RepID=A0ABR3B3U9_PHYBL